jgi:NAD(P)-dependent dehydrogenase (short-subunit alcohol dehydrogenase family)
MRIEGSVAVVTGANRGLGQHFAGRLLTRSAKAQLSADRGTVSTATTS